MEILRIEDVDTYGKTLCFRIMLNITEKNKVNWGKEIDGDEYKSDCWYVEVNKDKATREFVNNELYYISNEGVIRSEIQLSDREVVEVENYILDYLNR